MGERLSGQLFFLSSLSFGVSSPAMKSCVTRTSHYNHLSLSSLTCRIGPLCPPSWDCRGLGWAHSGCSLDGSCHSPHHRKDGRGRRCCLSGPEIPDLSLPSRSTDGFLSDRVIIRPSHDQGYMLILCAHLWREMFTT